MTPTELSGRERSGLQGGSIGTTSTRVVDRKTVGVGDLVNVLHPLFVHLHIAFLLMAFLAMGYWLFKGLAASVLDDKIFRFA